MGLHWAEHSIEIAAPIELCFETICDYETFPRWQNAVLATEVTKRDRKTKLGELVNLEVDGKVRRIRYTLRYHYDPPHRIWWDFVGGHGIKDVGGDYNFERRGPELTAATYRLGVDPGTGVPGPVASRLNRQLIRRSVEDLREEAERRYGSGSAAGRGGLRGAVTGAVGSVASLPLTSGRRAVELGVGAASAGLGVAGAVIGRAARIAGLRRDQEAATEERPRRD